MTQPPWKTVHQSLIRLKCIFYTMKDSIPKAFIPFIYVHLHTQKDLYMNSHTELQKLETTKMLFRRSVVKSRASTMDSSATMGMPESMTTQLPMHLQGIMLGENKCQSQKLNAGCCVYGTFFK